MSLPPEHPLYKLTREVARPIFCTPDHSPLHKLIHDAYLMIPREYETIKTIRFDPKWQSTIGTKIAPNKEVATEEEENNRDNVQVYSDGSLIDGGVGAAAVLYRKGVEEETLHKHLGPANQHTVYEAELVGIILALKLIQNISFYRTALIALNNMVAIQATELMASSPGLYLVDEIHTARSPKKISKRRAEHARRSDGYRGI